MGAFVYVSLFYTTSGRDMSWGSGLYFECNKMKNHDLSCDGMWVIVRVWVVRAKGRKSIKWRGVGTFFEFKGFGGGYKGSVWLV